MDEVYGCLVTTDLMIEDMDEATERERRRMWVQFEPAPYLNRASRKFGA